MNKPLFDRGLLFFILSARIKAFVIFLNFPGLANSAGNRIYHSAQLAPISDNGLDQPLRDTILIAVFFIEFFFQNKMNLVVLELQQDKFFVELTSRDPEDVFQDHKDEKTNHIFTQKFKPTSFILESVEATKEDLETITFR